MRLGAHQTFTLRESWLYKGLNALQDDQNIFSKNNAAEQLGVGKNMAEAISYWLQACQLAFRGDGLELTSVAKTILKHDPYLELDGTILVIHYLLTTNEDLATAWYWFFNKLGVTEFDTETLNIYLASFIEKSSARKIQENTIQREVACLISTYRPPRYSERETPETINPSPFSRFGFLKPLEGGRFQKQSLNVEQINPHIFAYLLFRYWSDFLQRPQSMTFDLIAKGDKSPALALSLSEEQTAQLLENISKLEAPNYLGFSRTGGFSIVTLDASSSKKGLEEYYSQNKFILGGR